MYCGRVHTRKHQTSGNSALVCDILANGEGAVPVPGAPAAGTRALVVPAHHAHGGLLLLQEPAVRADHLLLQHLLLLFWADPV